MGRRDEPFPGLGIQTSKKESEPVLPFCFQPILIAVPRAQALKSAIFPCLVLSSPFPESSVPSLVAV